MPYKPGDKVTYYRQRKPNGRFAATYVKRSSEFRARIELEAPYGKHRLVTVDLDALELRRVLPALPEGNGLAYAQGGFGYGK